jgi:hypothetical protein
MKVLKTLKSITITVLLLASISCSNNSEKSSGDVQAFTFESIAMGTSLEDARELLAEKYTEYHVGSNPQIDVMMFENGNQLGFTDGVLTAKNTAEEMDKAMGDRAEKTRKD